MNAELRMKNEKKLQNPSSNHQRSSKAPTSNLSVWLLDVLWILDVEVWMFPLADTRYCLTFDKSGRFEKTNGRAGPLAGP